MELSTFFFIAISTIFINNYVFTLILGVCPYLGVSKQLDSAIGMGLAVIFVMTLASFATWVTWAYLLDPLTSVWGAEIDLRFLRTVSFILVIAALVQFVEMVLQKTAPGLYTALGIYLPLITTNCAVLGVAVLNVNMNYNLLESSFQGFTAGVGFTLALVLMAGVREKLEISDVPKPLQGFPIGMIMAGLMAIAFYGFAGLKIG